MTGDLLTWLLQRGDLIDMFHYTGCMYVCASLYRVYICVCVAYIEIGVDDTGVVKVLHALHQLPHQTY